MSRTGAAVRNSVTILSILAMSGCGEKASIPTSAPQTIFLTHGNPNSDTSRCGCAGSRPVFIENRGSSAKFVIWQDLRRDRISGEYYNPQPGQQTIPPNIGNEQFIGCSIDAPTTSCRFDVQYSITSNTSLLSVGSRLAGALGTKAAASAPTCQALCSDPTSGSNGSCLQLGVRFYEPVAPVKELIEIAVASGTDVPKQAVMAKLGLGADDDECDRGDIENKDGVLTNDGPSYCRFRSRDLPAAALKAIGLTRPIKQSGMSIFLPKKIKYRTEPPAKTVGVLGTQISDDQSPLVVFDGPGEAKLNARYGGPIQSMSRISLFGQPPQTVIQTANGCIAVDEKAR